MTDRTPLPPVRLRPRPEAATARTRTRRLRIVAAALVVALIATATWAAFFSGGPGGSPAERWTTVTATRGAVAQRITGTGTVSHVNEISVRFPAAGTVTEVRVGLGDAVSPGDVLAVMDDSALRLKHVQAQAAVDAALLAVRQASDARASGPAAVPGAAAPVVAPAPQPDVDLGRVAGTVGEANAQAATLASLQQAAQDALAEVRRVCPAPAPLPSVPSPPAVTPSGAPSSGPSGGPSGAPSAAPSLPSSGAGSDPSAWPSTSASASAPAVDPAACRQALASAAAAQNALAVAQERAGATNLGALGALQGAAQAIAGAVAQFSAWASALAGAATGGSASAGSPPAASAAQGSATDSELTAARIHLTKARRALDQARQDLERATLRAPMAGVVATLPFTVGSPATPSQAVVVSAPGAVLVTLTVPTASYPFVATHQRATLRGSGGARADATVSSKELVPQPTGGYVVTLLSSTARSDAFPAGTSVSIEIEVGAVGDAVVVPLTAITRSGDLATVRLLTGTEVTEVPVTLGRIGDTRAEVVEGVHPGDRLVVADATKPIPGFGLGG